MTTEAHEPSYYEIALTNRQVVTAFVILLACLLAAFLSGVWVGRGGMGPAEEEARAAPPPRPREAAALEEFEFFSEDGEAAAPAAQEGAGTPPGAPPPRTLREDLEAVAPPGEDRAALEPEEEAAADEADVAAAEPERPPAAPREEPAAPAAPPAAQEITRTPPGAFVIQVFSSPEEDQATRVRDRLAGSGYKAFLSPVDVAGRTMYRVRIGPFTSRDKAQEVAERVRRTHRLDTWVTQ